MSKPTIGMLPLYLKLYDDALPEARAQVEPLCRALAAKLEERGVSVFLAPVCRVAEECRAAVAGLEAAGADLLVTLHLAYSPSLEAIDALAETRLPLVLLDTTPTYAFGPQQDPAQIMLNHGIHGVQDLCNLLLRRGKAFQIEAGHWERSHVLDRVAAWARPARLATAMRRARVGRIGPSFAGMGDFAVPPETLRAATGAETVPCSPETLRAILAEIDEADVEREMALDQASFAVHPLDTEAHRQTTRACLAVRRWIERERLSGFSVNFLAVDSASGIPTVPFLEASKAMARGLGYAGEGDVLTAALVGALASLCPNTTFTEMFCPDWEGDTIFLSHMGEVNPRVVSGKPVLMEKPFPWTDAADPVVATGRLGGGPAVWVDLAPGPDDAFSLILAPVEMIDPGEDRFEGSVRGWMRPPMPVAEFLVAYSHAGGTHHAALVYDGDVEEISRFGELMGWDVCILG